MTSSFLSEFLVISFLAFDYLINILLQFYTILFFYFILYYIIFTLHYTALLTLHFYFIRYYIRLYYIILHYTILHINYDILYYWDVSCVYNMIFIGQAENKRIQEINLSWNQLCGKGTVGVLKALEVSSGTKLNWRCISGAGLPPIFS